MKELGKKIILTPEDQTEFITKPELIEKLLYFRDDWLEKCGTRSYSRDDGRAPWYIGIATDLSNALDANIIPKSVNEAVNRFLKWYTGPFKNNFQYPVINKSSEISRTETIINQVLQSLGVDTKNIDPKKNIIRKFLGLRYDHCEEIPEKLVHSTDGMYKIRTGWLLGIACDIEYSLDQKFLSKNVLTEAKEYIIWWSNVYGNSERYQIVETPDLGGVIINTQADIDRGNKILDLMLKDLGFEAPNI